MVGNICRPRYGSLADNENKSYAACRLYLVKASQIVITIAANCIYLWSIQVEIWHYQNLKNSPENSLFFNRNKIKRVIEENFTFLENISSRVKHVSRMLRL